MSRVAGRAEPGEVNIAVARRAFRQVWLGATVWALVFGGTAASAALTYVTSFPTVANRQLIAATTGKDTGLAVLLGPVSAIGTVGGYTVYKCFAFLTTIGAIWGLLAATRLLRGEEDAGRWQLVTAGATRPSRATAATLAALGVAVGIIFCGTALVMVLTGRSPKVGLSAGDAVLYGLSIAIAPAVFVAVGAVTSQLGRTRRLASGLGMTIFGAAFVVRMIADAGPETRWLLWLTPFGWTELMRPFTENDPWPLVPAALTVMTLGVAATVLAGRRDAGDGAIASRDSSPPRPFGLGSALGLAARLELPAIGAWCVGTAAAGLAFGIIAKVASGTVPPSLTNTLQKFGVHGTFIRQYLSVAFLLTATVAALLPASQIGAASDEETSGRLAHVMARSSRRAAVFGSRLALGAAGAVVAATLAGLATWIGAMSQGVHIGVGTMIGSGLNVVPTALLALGIGAVALSVAPRLAVATVYTVVIGSLLIDLLGSMVLGIRWLSHFSLFHYMALAPSQPAHPATQAITVALAAALCVVATLLFERRDLQRA